MKAPTTGSSGRTCVASEYDEAEWTKVHGAVEFRCQYAGPSGAEYTVGSRPTTDHAPETEKALTLL